MILTVKNVMFIVNAQAMRDSKKNVITAFGALHVKNTV
jgi:hypothetical protein